MTTTVSPVDDDRRNSGPNERPAAIKRRSAGGPWVTAYRKLIRDRAAVASFIVFIAIVVACALAPIYAANVAHTNPFRSNIDGTITVNGEQKPVLESSTVG